MGRILAIVVLFLGLAMPAAAQTVTPVEEVIETGSLYNDRQITVEGELVGDFGVRGDGTVWTQLNDDSYAERPLRESGPHAEGNTGIGVRFDGSLGFDLEQPGGYRWHGPTVRATGIWHFHDLNRGGESYLEVISYELITPARPLEDPAFWPLWLVGAGLLLVAYYLYWHKNQEPSRA
ncbi:MAG: hypothetical protein HKN80_11460 [Acidimicrobiia bacterium]|nr:hypothetical protein [Acidimicrobiia bacterium]